MALAQKQNDQWIELTTDTAVFSPDGEIQVSYTTLTLMVEEDRNAMFDVFTVEERSPDSDPSKNFYANGVEDDNGRPVRAWAWQAVVLPSIAEQRQTALRGAMAYGNAITGGEINQWAGVEPLSWAQQRAEALTVLAGGTLDEFAVLPGLAQDKGVTQLEYAQGVKANAERYQRILRAAIYLRRMATTRLLDEALDTPAKIEAAVLALRAETDALAAQLLG